MFSEEFQSNQDKEAILKFTEGAYLQDLGYNNKSLSRQGIYRAQSLRKKRVMSALGASGDMNESTLKQAIQIEKQLKVASCDFAISTQSTALDPYSNLKSIDIVILNKESVRHSAEPAQPKSSVLSSASRVRSNKQAADNVNRARLRRVLDVDPMVSHYSQNLFKSDREKQLYTTLKTPKSIFSP